MQNATKKGLSEKQKTILSGMGAYATHKGISFNEWQADRLIAKEYTAGNKKFFMDFKK